MNENLAMSTVDRLRSTSIIARNKLIRRTMRRLCILGYRAVFGDSRLKNIGGVNNFYMCSEFLFADYKCWGGKHNNGFKRLIELGEQSKIIFDIGAHIGLCSLPLSRVMPKDGIIYAFEPDDDNLKYLRRHVELNKIRNIVVVPYIVGDVEKEKREFYTHRENPGISSICCARKGAKGRKVLKRQITIDGFVKENSCIPDVIKIDVEGSEVNALLGAKDVLEKYHPEVILSVHPTLLRLVGHDLEGLRDLVRSLGYDFHDVETLNGISGELEFKEYYLR